MNRRDLAHILNEMEGFNKELEAKFEDIQNRRKAANIKSIWLDYEHESDFLLSYYNSLRKESEKQIQLFLDRILRLRLKKELHSRLETKDIPKVSEVEEITRITFNCIFCYTDILISKQAEHLADCSEADEIYHKTASKPAELVCEKCGRKDFKNAKGFSKHVNSCGGGVTVCSDCKNDFKTERGLIKHKSKCKGKDIERYQCQKCDKWIPVSNKVDHQRYHIREEKKKRTKT